MRESDRVFFKVNDDVLFFVELLLIHEPVITLLQYLFLFCYRYPSLILWDLWIGSAEFI